MWLLRNDEKGLLYRVIPGKAHIVSRKDGDLLLLGDQSISRKHAQIIVQNENSDEGIALKDLGSKYGSFAVIGDGELTRLEQDQQVILKDGDHVRFGSQWNLWRAEFVPLVVATSTLTQQEKVSVKAMVSALGGQMLSDWTERCSHLTMNRLTVTVKVVCALAAGQRIVTPAYWQSMSEALAQMQSTLPNVDNFLPPLAEAILNPSEVSFTPNPSRSLLFKGWTFVGSSAKQTLRIKPMIAAAGGNIVEFSSRSCSEKLLTQKNVVLMQHSPADKPGSQQSQVPEGYMPIARKLRTAGVRCVPESEIGLAIIYCSTSKYCNPRHSPNLIKPSQNISHQATQPAAEICPSSESLESSGNNMDCSEKQTSKRPCNPDEDEEAQKKAKNENSGDMFESQGSGNTVRKTLRQTSLSFKRSTSNDSSGPSKPKTSNNPAPSLDMFAPSGERSGIPAASGEGSGLKLVRPSCEDMFASGKELQTNKTPNDKDEFSSVSTMNPKRPRDVAADDDEEFLFVQTKKTNNNTLEKNEADVFSFRSARKQNRQSDADMFASDKELQANQTPNDKDELSLKSNKTLRNVTNENDEFSFVQTKNSNNKTLVKNEVQDEFSFTSTRKRNRQSDPDMFASSAESPGTDSVSSLSKVRKIENTFSSKFDAHQSNKNDEDVFAFPDQLQPIRRQPKNREKEEVLVAAIHLRDIESAPDINKIKANKEAEIYIRPERKKLVTYGKTIPTPDNVKKEVKEVEVDALARELQETTIVIVKPLLAKREKPVTTTTETNVTGKNFKKFRKVVGVNKRLVPKIIGGSDLAPYCKYTRRSPPPQTQHPPRQDPLDDIWAFNSAQMKKKR